MRSSSFCFGVVFFDLFDWRTVDITIGKIVSRSAAVVGLFNARLLAVDWRGDSGGVAVQSCYKNFIERFVFETRAYCIVYFWRAISARNGCCAMCVHLSDVEPRGAPSFGRIQGSSVALRVSA